MQFLYGLKTGRRQLVATFDTEPQLAAYVGWCTLRKHENGTFKFEQGSALATSQQWESSSMPLTDEDATLVVHNPTPSML